jgi:hypothetical protein
MNFILIHFGFPPLIIKTEDKQNYFSALRQADAGMIEPFFEYINKNLIRSLEIMISGAMGESIEEDDDIDKEIALLKAKMASKSKEERPFFRRKKIVLDFYDNSIVPLWKEFVKTCEAFDDFYSYHEKWIETSDFSDKSENQIEIIRQNITEETSEFILAYVFTGLKKKGQENFTFISRYQVKLDLKNSIRFRLYMNQKTILEKDYDSQLTQNEINFLCKECKFEHKKALENKI